jgi:hypothetical protein
MKSFILITLFFSFYFITVKDIYDEKMFLTEDVKILENEIGQKDSIILKLQYQNEKLKQKISKMTIIKKPKKQTIKPIIKKENTIEVANPVVSDTNKIL